MSIGVARLREKRAEFAPGIPAKKIEPLPFISKPTQFQYNLQAHRADVAGKHYDLRLADPSTGQAHSWALKKLPGPGEATYAPIQPTHRADYLGFSGKIPKGYGAGEVESLRLENAEVVHSGPNEVRFNLYGHVPEQYVLKRTNERMWVLHNATPSRSTRRWGKLIPDFKPSLGSVKFKDLDPTKPGEIWQPKVDGAHGLLVAEGGKPIRLFSYREAKNETGLVEHTHKLPNWWKNVAPVGLKPTVLRVEVTGSDAHGRPVPSSVLGGVLNATVPHSRQMQKDMGIKLKLLGFGTHRADGQAAENLPYQQQLETVKRLARDIPILNPMPTATTVDAKRRLLADVARGEHALTREGLVVIKPEEAKTLKAPITETHDVYIKKVLPGAVPGEAGGYEFSWGENGPVAGVVGTGFSRKQRKEMLENPDQWVGQVAKVRAKEKFRSGALRSPVHVQMHESKGPV